MGLETIYASSGIRALYIAARAGQGSDLDMTRVLLYRSRTRVKSCSTFEITCRGRPRPLCTNKLSDSGLDLNSAKVDSSRPT